MYKINYPDYYYNNKKKFKVSNYLWNNYKWQLKNSIKNIIELNKFFNNWIELNGLYKVTEKYNFLITPYFLSLINFLDKNDPLLLQVLPDIKELDESDNFKIDPFFEKEKNEKSYFVQRYQNRVLLITTNKCASFCRYCTRKWNWNSNYFFNKDKFICGLDELKKNEKIREVIISGGDPLMLNTDFLEFIIKNLLLIKHIEVIRIATRILTFLPQRIERKLINVLKKYKPIWIVTHFNHPNEITPETEKSVEKLLDAKVSIVNQSVLLKNINDNFEILNELNEKLQILRIKPYYLFQCDLVSGTKHFHTAIENSLKIVDELRKKGSGITIPDYVIDTKDYGKIVLNPQNIFFENDKIIVKDLNHNYIIYI